MDGNNLDEEPMFFEDIMNSNVEEDGDSDNDSDSEDDEDGSESDEDNDDKGGFQETTVADSKRN